MANLSTARRLWLNGKEIKVLSVNGNKCFERAPYQCEVEYLQSTGTQWIQFYHAGNNKQTKIDIVFELTEINVGRHLFGGNITNNNRATLGWMDGGKCYFVAGTPYTTNTNFVQEADKIFDASVIFDDTNKTISATLNGESLTTSSYAGYLYDSDIFIFSRAGNTSSTRNGLLKLYKFTISLDGVAQHDFIPVLDWDDTPCLYDKVSGQLFYNAGTGAFLYGEKVDS